jgi:NAD+ synthase
MTDEHDGDASSAAGRPGPFSANVLAFDCAAEAERIAESIRGAVRRELRRQGLVVALSGGIDSSVVASLCVRALGAGRVFGLLLPEKDSSEETRRLSRLMAGQLGIETEERDITPLLEAAGCYQGQIDAIRRVIPEFGSAWKSKIVLPSVIDADRYRLFSVVAQSPGGSTVRARLDAPAYLGIVAATNFKQRVRKMLEYYHADRLNYAVAGTPNRLEYDQGFFVKLGDGAADLKPIAHLYKTQVYRLAASLGVPDEICRRPPTTDTYSLPQSQEEFYFALPYAEMDLCLWAYEHAVPPAEVAPTIGLSVEQVERIFRDIEAKRRVARYLHHVPSPLTKP